MKLKNKVAVITGSSRGMGKATALLFAKEGANIVVNCITNKAKGLEVVEKINKLGSQAILVQADISKSEEVKKLFDEAVKKFGTVDILINNAGIGTPKELLELTSEDWEKTFRTNVIGTFLCSQEASKIMLKKKKGKIINISSLRGLPEFGRSGYLDYCASKAAVISFTKNLAKALAPHINVNSVAPGFVDTEMSQVWDKKTRESAIKDACLKRLVKPEEVAKANLYLASDDSDAVTGTVLVVDCGFCLK